MNKFLHKQVELDKVDIARVLRPHLTTQVITDADTGHQRDAKTIRKSVVMTGTEQEFSFGVNYAFKEPDSVMIKISPIFGTGNTPVALSAEMSGADRFRILAASSVANLKIIVEMRGW